MKTREVAKLPPLERLLYWIREREGIRLRREAGEHKPWTDDGVMQRYRFCNVRRMDDRVSRWLLENWYGLNFGHPNMLVACALARHFNQPEALEAIGFPCRWEPERIKKVLRAMKVRGKRIFNGAYMVRGIGTADKTEMVVTNVCQPLVRNPPGLNASSMRGSVEALLPYWGFSYFMAGQVVADLRWAVPGTWKDAKTWAPVGPGSKRGMNRLENRLPTAPLSQAMFEKKLLEVINYCSEQLPRVITKRLEAIDWQNCLCEFDKYERTIHGEGKPKQLYPGLA